MSVADLLTPLSVGKEWSNLQVNSIITNSIDVLNGGSTLQGPLTISENSTGSSPIVSIIEQNPAVSYGSTQLQLSNQSGSEKLSFMVRNDPTAVTGMTSSGAGGYFLNTTSPTANLNFLVNTTTALTCNWVSPGVTQTSIQNILLPTTGGTASNLNYYEEYSAPFVFSGPWGATTYTRNVTITRVGRMCTLKVDGIIQSSSVAAAIGMTGTIPARFVPIATADSNSCHFQVTLFDRGILVNGDFNLASNGNVLIQYQQNAGPFPILYGTSSGIGNSGFNNMNISYSV